MNTDASFRLDGRRALITGASRGVGQAIATEFARAGACLALVARERAHLTSTLDDLRAFQTEIHVFGADLEEFVVSADLVRAAAETLGGIDILVNAADVSGKLGVDGLNVDLYRRLVHVNLRAPMLLTQAARPFLFESNSASVINLSSVVATRGGSGVYAPLKAALGSYTTGLAREWGSDGVRVNAIAPGLIAADLAQEILSDECSSNRLMEGVSLGRIGGADAVASVARFLASDAAGYITGAVIPVDGGWIHQF
jgi:NAD(P)-dependent dehydrogenase (short-subunit alcohol dehydrogenase family)